MLRGGSAGFSSSRRTLVAGALALWASLCLLNFVFRDPPFARAPWVFFAHLLRGNVSVFLGGHFFFAAMRVILFFVKAGVPGWLLISRRISIRDPILKATLALLAGWGLWMILVELLAIFFLLNRWTMVLVWLVLLVIVKMLPKGETPAPVCFPSWKEQTSLGKGIWIVGIVLVALITWLSFYHAVVFPVVYHDSLILYVDYAEQTYRQNGFPVEVCLQVGIGLGANYPHLFPLTAASIGKLWGSWSDLDAQTISPLMFLLASILIYYTVLLWGRRHLWAMLAVVIFRSIPYANVYASFATDYSVAIALTALCLFGIALYITDRHLPGLEIASLAVAIGMHLNYLMGILWLPVLFAPLLVRFSEKTGESWYKGYTKRFWLVFAIGILLGSPWYVRNQVVTGNPVYAFFPEIFGGRNINLAVLESCFHEWRAHGDGIGRFGQSLGAKIAAIPAFLFTEVNYHWKYGPALTGLAIPGLILCLIMKRALLWTAALVFLSVTAYHFLLGDLYLYHTLMMAPALAVLGICPFVMMERRGQAGVAAVILLVGIFCGLGSAVVGGKMMRFDGLTLRLPGEIRAAYPEDWPERLKNVFLEMKLGDSWRMWRYLDANIDSTAVLTHENRHHYIDRDIRLVGLDDCELTPLYDHPFDQVVSKLLDMGVEYYLYVPFEDDHPIVKRLGVHGENLRQHFELEHVEGPQRLYRLKP